MAILVFPFFFFVYSAFEMLKFYLSVYGEITNENALNCTFRHTLLGFPSLFQLLINSQQVCVPCVLCVYVCARQSVLKRSMIRSI